MNRRTYLSAVAASVPLGGCLSRAGSIDSDDGAGGRGGRSAPGTSPEGSPTSTGPSATPATRTEPSGSFSTTIDMVEDVGCDPTGGRPCNHALKRAAREDALLVFPEGVYRFDDYTSITGFEHLGIAGRGDVRFLPPTGFNDSLLEVIVDDVVFRNVDVDIRADNTTAGLKFHATDGLDVEDVEYVGRGRHDDDEVANSLSLSVADPSGTGTVRNYVAKHGSAWAHYKGGKGRVGVWIGPRHRGTIRLVDCRLGEFGNNGIYATDTVGDVQVVGGEFWNNNVGSVRIGGKGSFVDGARIELDRGRYTGPRTREDADFFLRGIIVSQKSKSIPWKPAGARVSNCDIRLGEIPVTGYGIVVWGPGRTLTVRDTAIRVDHDGAYGLVRARQAPIGIGHPPSPPPRWVDLRNVTIEGTAAGVAAIYIEDGSDSRIRDSVIRQPGADRDGIHLVGSTDLTVSGGSIQTGRYPVRIDVEGRRLPGSCLVRFDGTRLQAGSIDGPIVPLTDGPDGTDRSGPPCVGRPPAVDPDEEARIGTIAPVDVHEDVVYGVVIPDCTSGGSRQSVAGSCIRPGRR